MVYITSPFLLSRCPAGPLLLQVTTAAFRTEDEMSGETYVIQNPATLQCLNCAGKKSMTHIVCMAPCTPIMLTHVSVSVALLIVLAVLVVDLNPGRAAKGGGGWLE